MGRRCELYSIAHLLRHKCGVVPAADFGGVAHQGCDLEEAFALHGKLTAEGVPVVETGPGESGAVVGGAEVGGEVVGVPSLAVGTGEVPAGGSRGGEVAVKVDAQGDGVQMVGSGLKQ